MVWPLTPLGAQVLLDLGPTQGWTDITNYARLKSAASGGGISITRGKPNAASAPDVTRCSLTLNNGDGRWSPGNPFGPYYGLLGRNTRLKVRVAEADPGGALALDGWRAGNDPAYANAPYAAAFATQGDLDVRVWLRMPRWVGHDGVFLGGQNGSWAFSVSNAGKLELRYWNTSSTYLGFASASAVTPGADGSLAVRFLAQTATGTVTWYTAPAMAGPWTQLGQVTGGHTAIFQSTSQLEVGRYIGYGSHGVNGEMFGFELRRAGTLVAAPDFTLLRGGETGLTDPQGNAWSWTQGAVPIDRGARFYGEVTRWPQRWDTSGRDVWCPVDAYGLTRRMGQGKSPVRSPMRSAFAAVEPAGYMPLEDRAEAARPSTDTKERTDASSTNVTFGTDPGTLKGTPAAAQLQGSDANMLMTVAPRSGRTRWSTIMFFKLAQVSSGDKTFARISFSGGTTTHWDLQASSTGYRWIGYTPTGTAVNDARTDTGTQTNWVMFYIEWNKSGSNVTTDVWWSAAGSNVFAHVTSPSFAGTLGYPTRVEIFGNADTANSQWAHVVVDDSALLYAGQLDHVANAFSGETAAARMMRVCRERGIPLTIWGLPDETAVCGAQPIVPVLGILRDAAQVDGGILQEARGHAGFHYRTRRSMYAQVPVALSYTGGHIAPPFEPTDDDDATMNDITLSRPSGGSVRAVQQTGRMSIQDPPDGAGTYDTSEDLNVEKDLDLIDQAYWRLNLGTVDEPRYPRVALDLSSSTYTHDAALTKQVALLDAGDLVAISDTPAWLPPGPIQALIQGYAEELDAFDWAIKWNAAPATPWDVAYADGPHRVTADSSSLGAAITSTATSLQINSATANAWTTSGTYFPMDILVGAEQIRISAISGTGTAQTATVTQRGLNGVQAAWAAGTPVDVWRPARAGL